jgi:hypothetical protein
MFDGDWVNISCLLGYFRRVELTNRVELSIPSPPHLNISLRVLVLIERQAVNIIPSEEFALDLPLRSFMNLFLLVSCRSLMCTKKSVVARNCLSSKKMALVLEELSVSPGNLSARTN